ncbi:MAG: nucleoside triphosphate pyrophosphohydrolase [Bacteroidales bacterium]|nr:nucleoside triphosphate pyrophosphohydrolase [Bacteroidales bacterium]
MMDKRLEAFKRLLDIVDEVRAKCPWDSVQTIESIRHLSIEETYELSEAILSGDLQEVKKELGDIMLHVALYAKMGSEKGAFDIADVLDGISQKMIVRHPHIFGNEKVADAEQVSQNWEKIKLEKEHNRSVLSGVPESLPALLKAYRMQQKAAGVGFEWPDPDDAWKKVEEEKKEFFDEIKSGNEALAEEEFGDLLFALINYGRMRGINAEDALDKTNRKFRQRFAYVEQQAREQGKGVHHLSLDEMIALWMKAKAQ